MKTWSNGGSSSLRWLLALLCVGWFCVTSPAARGQDSTPPSTDTGQPSTGTGQIDEFILRSLRPILVQALDSSIASDSNSQTLQQQINADNLQRTLDERQRLSEQAQRQIEAEQRMREQQDSAQALATSSGQAAQLRTWFDGLSSRLTTISGTEQQRYDAAVHGIDAIQAGAKALETQVAVLRVGCWTFGITAAAGVGYAVGHIVFHWW
jgi:TolA-binding protein